MGQSEHTYWKKWASGIKPRPGEERCQSWIRWCGFFFFFEAIRWCGFVLTVCMKMSFLLFYLIQLKNNIRSTKHIFYGQQRTSPMINFLCFGVKCKKILLSFGRLEFEKLFVKPKSSPVDQEKHYLLQKIFYALKKV